LSKLKPLVDDKALRDAFRKAARKAKSHFADWLNAAYSVNDGDVGPLYGDRADRFTALPRFSSGLRRRWWDGNGLSPSNSRPAFRSESPVSCPQRNTPRPAPLTAAPRLMITYRQIMAILSCQCNQDFVEFNKRPFIRLSRVSLGRGRCVGLIPNFLSRPGDPGGDPAPDRAWLQRRVRSLLRLCRSK